VWAGGGVTTANVLVRMNCHTQAERGSVWSCHTIPILRVPACVMMMSLSLGYPVVMQEALAAKQHEGIFVGWSNDGTCGQNRVHALPEHLGHPAGSCVTWPSLSTWGVSVAESDGPVGLRSARHGRI